MKKKTSKLRYQPLVAFPLDEFEGPFADMGEVMSEAIEQLMEGYFAMAEACREGEKMNILAFCYSLLNDLAHDLDLEYPMNIEQLDGWQKSYDRLENLVEQLKF